MTLEKRNKIQPIVSWILAMLLCPLGVCFAVKSSFGVSMIEAPVFALHLKISQYFSWFTYGTAEYTLQTVVLLIMCITIRKFKWRYLLSFGAAFLDGLILDGWNIVFSWIAADTLLVRIILAIIGCILIAFAVALFFKTWLPVVVWELVVKEIADNFKFNLTKVKWIYDFSSLGMGIILMFVFFGKFRFDVIGIGTVAVTFINAPLIGAFSKLQDKFWDSVTK